MKKIIKLTILNLILSLTLASSLNAQDQRVNVWKPDANMLTPSEYNFQKYGQIPVSEYTGIPDISIPLYTIKLKDLSVPLRLTYHGGGIRVSEEASWVGLGWNLPTGSIVQNVCGIDDFQTSPTYVMNMPDYLYCGPMYYPPARDYDPGLYSYTNDIQRDNYSFVAFKRDQMLQNGNWVPINNYTSSDPEDRAPDIMTASFFGYNVKFMKDPKSSQIVVLNKKGYRVSLLELPSGDPAWEIIVPNGTKYYFEQMETTHTSSNYNPNNWDDYNTFFTSQGPGPTNTSWSGLYPTNSRTWLISKIVTINNDTVNFEYTPSTEKTDYGYSCSWDVYKKQKTQMSGFSDGAGNPMEYGPIYSQDIFPGGTSTQYYDYVRFNLSTSTTTPYYLSRIDFPNGHIDFETSSRDDYLGARKLDLLIISNNSNTIKSYTFSYQYSQANQSGLCYDSPKSSNELSERLVLTSFRENQNPPYVFSYDPEQLPKKNSFQVDLWGFYNGQVENTSLIPPLPYGCLNDSQLQSLFSKNINDKTAHLQFCKAQTLEQIKYPTGGSTYFDWELNYFTSHAEGCSGGDNISGNGLRIKTITNKDSDGNIISQTKYDYYGGKEIFPQKHSKSYQQGYVLLGSTLENDFTVDIDHWVSKSSDYFREDLFGSGNYIGYDSAKVAQQSANKQECGTTVKSFINNPDVVPPTDNPYFVSLPAISNDYQNGLVTKESKYDNKGNPVSSIQNYYSFITDTPLYYGTQSVRLGNYEVLGSDYNSQGYDIYDSYIKDLFTYYPIFKTETLLDSTVSTMYLGGQDVKESKAYSYNANNFVSLKKVSASDNHSVYESYLYPNDAMSSSLFSSYQQTNYMFMVEANRLSTRVRTAKWKDTQNGQISTITYYYDYNKSKDYHVVVDSVSTQQGSGPETTALTYDKYDSLYNCLQYTERGTLKTSLIWGYNHTHIIAKIVGATYSQVESAIAASPYYLTVSELETYSDNDSETTLRTELNKVRQALPNAMVTTYTYNPMIGVTSITDPKGEAKQYIYDSSGRLYQILDNDGKILKQYEYHYQNQ